MNRDCASPVRSEQLKADRFRRWPAFRRRSEIYFECGDGSIARLLVELSSDSQFGKEPFVSDRANPMILIAVIQFGELVLLLAVLEL
jgi:hypothetical protein